MYYQPLAQKLVVFVDETATAEIYTLSLHDALPISKRHSGWAMTRMPGCSWRTRATCCGVKRSEEHTSELQSRQYLVCRLLLEKKKVENDPMIARTMTYSRQRQLMEVAQRGV